VGGLEGWRDGRRELGDVIGVNVTGKRARFAFVRLPAKWSRRDGTRIQQEALVESELPRSFARQLSSIISQMMTKPSPYPRHHPGLYRHLNKTERVHTVAYCGADQERVRRSTRAAHQEYQVGRHLNFSIDDRSSGLTNNCN
jgi:hypothetical protein